MRVALARAEAANAVARLFGGDDGSDDWMRGGEPAKLVPATRLHHRMGFVFVLHGISFLLSAIATRCKPAVALRLQPRAEALKLVDKAFKSHSIFRSR